MMDFNWGDEIEIYKVFKQQMHTKTFHPPAKHQTENGKKSYFSIKVNKSIQYV